MSTRDDFNKVLSYAKSHGIKVTMRLKRPGVKNQDAAWILFETKSVVVMYKRTDPFTELTASLLHEISHLITYSMNKNDFKEYLKASAAENPTKTQRYEIYIREKIDIAGMAKLHKLLRLQSIKLNYIKLWADYDVWQYKVFYDTGKFPKRKVRIAKYKYLKKKWKLTKK